MANQKIESFIRAMHYPPHKGALLLTQKGYVECKSFKEYLINVQSDKLSY